MAIGIPDLTRDASISQDEQQHLSHDSAQPNSQNSLTLSSSPIVTGIHVSPFNSASAENSQPILPSSFDDPLASRVVPDTSLEQEGIIFPTGFSGNEELPSISIRQHSSLRQTDHNETIVNTSPLNQLSQTSQPIQLRQIQNNHQSQHAGHLAIQSGFQSSNSSNFPDNVPTEASLDARRAAELTASHIPLQGMGLQTSTQAAFMTALLPGFGSNSADQQTQREQVQHFPSSRVAEFAAQGLNHLQFSARNPFQGDGYAESGDRNLLRLPVGLLQESPDTGGLSAINKAQNVMQQIHFSRRQYLSRPGQIYERFSRQTQLPFSPAAVHPFVPADLNQTAIEQSVAGILPPFSHSTSTLHPIPILPAASAGLAAQGTTPASVKVEPCDRDCNSCGKRFKSKKDLQRHVARMHILKGRHPCPDPGCTQSFAEAHKLKRHFRTVHLKCRPFKCAECDSAFGEKGNMAQHYRKAHGAESSKAKRVKRS